MTDNPLFRIALNKATSLCSRREYCIREIREKIDSWGVTTDDGEKIIELLLKEKYIDEERYANAFTRDRFRYNKWGRVKVALHLKAKNIPGETIKQALDSIDNEQYIKSLRDLISSHRRMVKAKSQYDLKAKLMRFGLSKGFESSLLYDILNDLEE